MTCNFIRLQVVFTFVRRSTLLLTIYQLHHGDSVFWGGKPRANAQPSRNLGVLVNYSWSC